LVIPSKRKVAVSKSIVLKVKDSSNINSFVVWSTGDTGWSIVFTRASLGVDKVLATQYDGYGSYQDTTFLEIPTTPYEESTIVNASNKFTVYPNPSNDFIQVKYTNSDESEIALTTLKFTVYNFMGVEVLKGENKDKIDVKTLAAGMYILHVEDQNIAFLKN
jgi:hypothetical protein